MPMRWAAYAGVSTTLAAGVILKALHQRSNFYSACVYLAQSNANLMILTNFIFLIVCAMLLAMQKLLYGPLRPIEIEQLYEKAWFAVTETCLAMTIFPRGELGGWFLVMFFSLLAGKVWGWIGEGRVEFLEQQPPSNPRLFHTRLAVSLALSLLFNSYLLEYSIKTVLQQARPDMMVMFGFEFAVLTITSASTAARYAMSLMEILIVRKQKNEILEERRQEVRRQLEEAVSAVGEPSQTIEEIDEMELDVPGWEEKGRWVFYLDLVTDFLKLNVYLAFFTILLTFYGLPIHIIRDVFFTCRSFINRIKDFMRYRTATRDMNERYPDATPEEVAAADVCIICRDEMTPWPPVRDGETENEAGTVARRRMQNHSAEQRRPKKLPCGHVLHFSCLRNWLERQQNCPTCRRPVLAVRRVGVAANLGNDGGGQDGHLPGQGQPGGADREEPQNRARIINFGPLRIGFGAGRGNLFNDLDQQVNGAEPVPADGAGNAAGNAAGVQQYGFGFGWNRNRGQDNRRTNSTSSIDEQIQSLEQQIQQEINGLRVASDQLHLLRMLQGELARVRIAQGNASTGQAGAIPSRNAFQYNAGQRPIAPPQTLVANSQYTMISAGSTQLPQGLVLPEGWTMLPLHRLEPGQHGSGLNTAIQNAGRIPEMSATGNTNTIEADQQNILATRATNGFEGATQTRHHAHTTPAATGSSSTGTVDNPTILPNGSAPQGSALDVATTSFTQPVDAIEAVHEDTNGRVPSPNLPTSQPSLPSWGSDNVQPVHTTPPNKHVGGKGIINGTSAEPGPATFPTSDPSREQDAKGKSKAATVEDFIEDVD